MKTLHFLLIFFLLFTANGCNKEPAGPGQPKAITLTSKGQEVIQHSNSFGIDLFRAVASAEESNLMLSPLSASTALTMLLNGCNSATYEQIRNMLGFEGLSLKEINDAYGSLVGQLLNVDNEVQLSLANAVWYTQDLTVRQEYLDSMKYAFDAMIGKLDFNQPSSLETINNWARDNTNGKITRVINEIDPQMVMFLMNALYFKGSWTYSFPESQTNQAPFHPQNENRVNVDMMRSRIPVKMYNANNATAVELPYGRQNFAMVIIVPDGALNQYLQEFDNTEWNEVTNGLDEVTDPAEIEMIMPKFKFEYEKYLNDQLKSLGMTDAFDPARADLSNISDKQLYIDFVKQNTFVDVNEQGTEAAAVTTIGMKEVSMPATFTVDKPFIFVIRERMTNTLLFIGKVEMPHY